MCVTNYTYFKQFKILPSHSYGYWKDILIVLSAWELWWCALAPTNNVDRCSVNSLDANTLPLPDMYFYNTPPTSLTFLSLTNISHNVFSKRFLRPTIISINSPSFLSIYLSIGKSLICGCANICMICICE